MVFVAQINVIVADLERSRAFYELLGFTFRSRNRDGEGPAEAWVSTNEGITVVLHSTSFAAWWDESAPQPSEGGPQIDVEFDSAERLEYVVAELGARGSVVVKPPTDMSWGQRFSIVLDPDGHRVGLKAPGGG